MSHPGAKINAVKAAVLAVVGQHNSFRDVFNPATTALFQQIDAADNSPEMQALKTLQPAMDAAATAHNVTVPLITAARNVWNAAQPNDPLPPPPSTESADGTRGVTVTDASGNVYSFGAPRAGGLTTLLNGQPWPAAGPGGAAEFYYKNRTVYCRNDTGSWFVKSGSGWLPSPDPTAQVSNLTPLRAQYATEAAFRAAVEATPGALYFDMTAAGIMKMTGGLSNPSINNGEVGRQIVWRGTRPEYGDVVLMKTQSQGFNPDGSSFPSMYCFHAAFRMPPGVTEGWLHYGAEMDPDCVTGTADFGWKFPGFEGGENWGGPQWGGYSIRTHNTGPRRGNNPPDYSAETYEYRPDLPGSENVDWPGATWVPGQLGEVDLFVRMNTPKNPATVDAEAAALWAQIVAIWARTDIDTQTKIDLQAVPGAQLNALWNVDGVREIWKDGKFIRRDTNVMWRLNPQQSIFVIDYIFMNGGVNNPTTDGAMHITHWPVVFHPTRRIGQMKKLSAAPTGTGPLAALPSAEGPHMAAIRALGAGEWYQLPPTTPDPVSGPNTGRSWSTRLHYWPEKGGCFISGQGPHGAVHADGHYDDIYFWDYKANRDICLTSGINTNTFAGDVASGAILIDPIKKYLVYANTGRAVYACGAHTYLWSGFNPVTRKYWCGGWQNGYGGDQHCFNAPWYANALPNLQAQETAIGITDRTANILPFIYSADDGTIDRGTEAGELWIPTKQAYFNFAAAGQVAIPGCPPLSGEVPAFGQDGILVWDSNRNKVIIGRAAYTNPRLVGKSGFFILDPDTGVCVNPNESRADEPEAPTMGQAYAAFDKVADKVVMMGGNFHGLGIDPNTGQRSDFLWLYDKEGVITWSPADGTWSEPVPFPTWELTPAAAIKMGFYCEEENVHFIWNGGDGRGDGRWWAYRHAVRQP